MARSANYALLGYKYQFLKTFLEILRSEESSFVVCERFEDIDLEASNVELRIQCKYHGAAEKYTLGKVYKPLLEFMRSFVLGDSDNEISYRLFAHFPNEISRVEQITENDCKRALGSTAKEFQKIIKTIKEKGIDTKAVASKITLEFGCDINELEKNVCQLLIDSGFSNDEIEQYVLSNGTYLILEASCKENESNRKISKSNFLAELRSTKAILMNEWVKELFSLEKYLKSKQIALKYGVDRRICNRTFIISDNLCSDSGELVKFIKDLRFKIHSDKTKHINNRLILVLDTDLERFNEIVQMLLEDNLDIHTGFRMTAFNEKDFLLPPAIDSNRVNVRGIPIWVLQIDHANILNELKPDIYYFLGMNDKVVKIEILQLLTITCEELPALTYNQLKYIFGMRGDYT